MCNNGETGKQQEPTEGRSNGTRAYLTNSTGWGSMASFTAPLPWSIGAASGSYAHVDAHRTQRPPHAAPDARTPRSMPAPALPFRRPRLSCGSRSRANQLAGAHPRRPRRPHPAVRTAGAWETDRTGRLGWREIDGGKGDKGYSRLFKRFCYLF